MMSQVSLLGPSANKLAFAKATDGTAAAPSHVDGTTAAFLT